MTSDHLQKVSSWRPPGRCVIGLQAYPTHESEIIGPPGRDDIVDGIVEDGNWPYTLCQTPMVGSHGANHTRNSNND